MMVFLACLLVSCSPPPRPQAAPAPTPTPALPTFQDVTARAGLRFRHYTGGFGKNYMPEIMGSGCAWIDYDNSGRQSLLLLNGTDFAGHRHGGHHPVLYRNNGNGTFADVSRETGLDRLDVYGMGAAVGDYDNDGWADVVLTTLHGNVLLHNRHGQFEDVTRTAGIDGLEGPAPWSTSVAFIDYDNDGKLDIFVCYYVRWTPNHDFYHPVQLVGHTFNIPQSYPGQTCRLFRNLGGGHFQDVTRDSGIEKVGKALGVAVVMRPDGWPDLFVANDSAPNFYFVNQKDGTFHEDAQRMNLATAEDGLARDGMGTDAADLSGDGRLAVVAANLPSQTLSLWTQAAPGRYLETGARAGLSQPSRLFSGFGAFFFDYDLDGRPDLLVACGNLEPAVHAFDPHVTYAERPLLFHATDGVRFDEVGQQSGLGEPLVARGAAWADYDGDGWPDFVVNQNDGGVRLYRNLGRPSGHRVELRLEGRTCNRSGIGAQVYLRVGSRWQHQWVKSGSSYCSQSQLPLLFGLGPARQADEVQVQWPGAAPRDSLGSLPDGRFTVTQGGAPKRAR
ncbi:MAG TPA: CRTAC1 family protein [Candidatus Xenobia bacterium]|jgi:hypothetical protein